MDRQRQFLGVDRADVDVRFAKRVRDRRGPELEDIPGGLGRRIGLIDHLEPLLRLPIAPYAGAAYGTFDDRLRPIGGINYFVTENLSALVTYNGEHYNSILSLSRGRYTGSLLYVSGGNIGAAWNVTW